MFIWIFALLIIVSNASALENAFLVSRYSFDVDGTDDWGSTDCSSQGSLPTTGAALIGDGGNSQVFDGNGDFFDCGDSSTFEFGFEPFTINTYLNEIDGSDSVIMSKGYHEAGQDNQILMRNHVSLGFQWVVKNGTGGADCSIDYNSLPTGARDIMITVMRNVTDGTVYAFYNGTTLMGSTDGCGEIGDNSFSFYFGRSPHSATEDYTGIVTGL